MNEKKKYLWVLQTCTWYCSPLIGFVLDKWRENLNWEVLQTNFNNFCANENIIMYKRSRSRLWDESRGYWSNLRSKIFYRLNLKKAFNYELRFEEFCNMF